MKQIIAVISTTIMIGWWRQQRELNNQYRSWSYSLCSVLSPAGQNILALSNSGCSLWGQDSSMLVHGFPEQFQAEQQCHRDRRQCRLMRWIGLAMSWRSGWYQIVTYLLIYQYVFIKVLLIRVSIIIYISIANYKKNKIERKSVTK